MGKQKKYDVHCGLVDTYRFGVSEMKEHHIKSTQVTAGSLKSAMKQATKFALEQDEIETRFAYEQPQWTLRCDVPDNDGVKQEYVSRIFKRDVHDTGKVAYIHVVWCNQPEKEQ